MHLEQIVSILAFFAITARKTKLDIAILLKEGRR
jgi:hypothetical protein